MTYKIVLILDDDEEPDEEPLTIHDVWKFANELNEYVAFFGKYSGFIVMEEEDKKKK